MENIKRYNAYKENNEVTDTNGNVLSPLDDDYFASKWELEDSTDPLSDDYNKYDNE